MTLSLSALNIRGILLDIEGTTTPITFVHDVLFPFARTRVRGYLATGSTSAEVLHDLARLREEHARDVAQQLNPPALIDSDDQVELDAIVAYINWLMDRDRKSTGLKSLQGRIWEQGYRDGALKAEVFTDVPPALRRWHGAGLRVAIFSSGSVLAQKLLFAHTGAGDLKGFLNAYFDTITGPKTESESFRRISSELQLDPRQLVFISDVTTELDAANDAGMHSLLCIRPGNLPQKAAHNRPTIWSFDEVKD